MCLNIFLSKPENKVGSKRSILWAGEHKMIVAEISTRRKQALSLKRWLGMQGRHGARAVTGQGRPEAGADTDAGSITRQTRRHGRHGPWVTWPRPLSCKKIKTTPRNVVLETWFGWETANLNEKGGREINIWKRPTISGNLTYNRNNNSSDIYIYIRIKRELFCRLNKINDYDSWV